LDRYLQETISHIRHLSDDIGGRGSCTPAEHQAGEYVRGQLRALGLQAIEVQAFRAISSTYRPFSLAFATALLGTLAALLAGSRGMLAFACVLNALGAWAMLAETDLAPNWTRWLLPKAGSQNVIAHIPPSGVVQRRLVICVHLDTHRTPIFYSSKAWHSAFSLLVGLAFVSMALGAAGFGLGALLAWAWTRWLGLALVPIEVFALALCLHADLTPFSPGANDNASGVGMALGLAHRLVEQPLVHTEVHLVFTGCEEVGAYGMAAYLDAHAQELGEEALYVILDEVGLGYVKYSAVDGLVIKHKTHPYALQVACQAAAAKPELGVVERPGIAYTDALVATRRGLRALTIGTLPGPEEGSISHWHQMSDTAETVNPAALARVYEFTWQILKSFDQFNA
jgi:hypothetical protein